MRFEAGEVRKPYGPDSFYQYVESTLQLPGHDADLTIVFPGGQRALLQWRVDGPSIDLCFDQPLDVWNQAEDMRPAPTIEGQDSAHSGVVQITIIPPEEFMKEAKNE